MKKLVKEIIQTIILITVIILISAIESLFALIPEYVLNILIIGTAPVVILMLFILVIYSE